MAPTGRHRSRRHPRAVTAGLLETRKQQTCETAALRVTAARLTRPAERCFLNQRESLRASRNAEPVPMHVNGRLERDLLNLVRGGERARLRRSPSPSPPPRRRRSSRVRLRSGSKRATRRRSPSPLSSSSDARHAPPRERRRRSLHRRSYWSSSSDELDSVTRAPGARATKAPAAPSDDRAGPPPLVRASLQHAVDRELVTPANAGAPTGGGGSRGRPETPELRPGRRTPETERRERLIVSQCLAELHKSVDKKRQLLQQDGKSVLSKVRSYLLNVAREARSQESEMDSLCSAEEEEEEEEETEEDIADRDVIPDPEFIPESQKIPDPEFIPEPVEIPDREFIPEPEEIPEPEFIPEPQEIPDPEFVPEAEEIPDRNLIPEAQEIPDPEFLPSPQPMADEERDMVVFMEESSEHPAATPASSLLRGFPTRADAEEEEERYEAGPDAGFWRRRAVSSTSSFLVTWGDDPARVAAWRPPVLAPVPGFGLRGNRALLPPPLLPARTDGSWREEAGQEALPRPSLWSSTAWPDCRRPHLPLRPMLQAPPAPQPPQEAVPWLRTCEELLPNPEPAEWRGARRCFSPTPDYPPMNRLQHFNRPHITQQHHRFPRPVHSNDAARNNIETARHDEGVDAWRYSRRKMF